jgi:hypothetical protein
VARTLITPTTVTRAGVAPPAETTCDVAQGNASPNDGSTYILLHNTGSTVTRNLTMSFRGSVDGQAVTPRPWAVPISTSLWIGPFDVTTYGPVLNYNGDNVELKISVLQFP